MKIKKYWFKIASAFVGVLALGLLAGCVYDPYPGGYYTGSAYYSYARCGGYPYYSHCYSSSQYGYYGTSARYYYPSSYYYSY